MTGAYSPQTLADLSPGDHLCLLYETEAEHRAVLTSFMRCGLGNGEKVIYLACSHEPETIVGYVLDHGLDPEPYLASGQLSILAGDDVRLKDGVLDPDELLAQLGRQAEQALAEGYTALRVTGEMVWLLREAPAFERVIEYEARLNEFFPGSACIGLCQYDRRRFDPAVMLGALCTHPCAVIGTELYDNFYYVPPSDLLKGEQSALELRYWIRNLVERKRTKEALEQRVAQLSLLNDIGGKVAAVLELDSVLKRAACLVQESFGYHHVSLFTLNEEREELVMRARAGDFADLFPSDHGMEVGQGMVGWVAGQGETLLANDADANPHYINFYPDLIPTRSELSVPISVGGETVGVLDIQSPQLNAFDENDVMVMETLADQIAVAIENARLYEAVRQELAERVRAERSLYESEERYRTLVNRVPVGVYRSTPDGRIIDANPALADMMGCPDRETMLEANAIDFYMDPEDRKRWQSEIEQREVLSNFERRMRRLDGIVIWVRDSARVVRDREGDVLYYEGIIEDITERKRMKQQMRRTDRLVAMGRVAAALAHEVKNPLQGIQGYLELLIDFPLEPGEREEYLHSCYQEIERLTEITGRILDLARPVEDAASSTPVHRLIERVLTLVKDPLECANIQVTTDVPSDLPPVRVVPERIVQVLLNLMLNAVDAVSHGGHIHVATGVDGEMVTLRMSNDGPPIPPELLDRIFDPFFTTKPDGTGLGLFIGQNIIEQHGGRLRVENLEEGRGVAFTIDLPIASPSRAPVSDAGDPL